MPVNNDIKKQSLLEQIKTEIAGRLPANAAGQASLFCDVYFKRVPLTELTRETPAMFAAMVAGQLEFLQQRKPENMLIRVFNPEIKRDGWDCRHTIVELANDDIPFLVDTASLALQELNLGVHLIVHPILNVERDAHGNLKLIRAKASKHSAKESFIHIHIEKQTAPAVLASVESSLQSRMSKVRSAVADWQLMKESLKSAIAEFGRNAPDLPKKVRKECVNFLEWVGNDHFMLSAHERMTSCKKTIPPF